MLQKVLFLRVWGGVLQPPHSQDRYLSVLSACDLLVFSSECLRLAPAPECLEGRDTTLIDAFFFFRRPARLFGGDRVAIDNVGKGRWRVEWLRSVWGPYEYFVPFRSLWRCSPVSLAY